MNCSICEGVASFAPHLSVVRYEYEWSNVSRGSQHEQSTFRRIRNDTAVLLYGFVDDELNRTYHRTHGHRISKQMAAHRCASSREVWDSPLSGHIFHKMDKRILMIGVWNKEIVFSLFLIFFGIIRNWRNDSNIESSPCPLLRSRICLTSLCFWLRSLFYDCSLLWSWSLLSTLLWFRLYSNSCRDNCSDCCSDLL